MKNKYTLAPVLAAFVLAGCATERQLTRSDEHAMETFGPVATDNPTPYSSALQCVNTSAGVDPGFYLRMGVGTFRDETGKFSNYDGGFAVTQGASHMVASGLARLNNHVKLVERQGVGVYNFELANANQKLLTDGETTPLPGGGQANWRVIQSGSVTGSTHYITGAITQMDYGVFSGGLNLGIDGIGGGGRQFVATVGLDMRLVDTQTTEVVAVATVQKQVVGHEYELGIFRFFDNTFVNFDAGQRSVEALGLAVRWVVEAALTQVMSVPLNTDGVGCLREAEAFWKENTEVLLDWKTIGNTIGARIRDRRGETAPAAPEQTSMAPAPTEKVSMAGKGNTTIYKFYDADGLWIYEGPSDININTIDYRAMQESGAIVPVEQWNAENPGREIEVPDPV